MNTRIKQLRKALNLTQKEFAKQIGVKQSSISIYESSSDTIPSAAVISYICRKFNVNEDWLRTGTGNMFKSYNNTDIINFMNDIKLDSDDSFKKKFLTVLSHLSEEQWNLIADMAEEFIQDRKDRNDNNDK